MEAIRFKVKRVAQEANKDLDASKLLGNPVCPKGFLDQLDGEDYFIAQINCEALHAKAPFPETGYLYFFVNIDSLKGKVLYTEKEPEELIDGINESFDETMCGDPTCLQIEPDAEGSSYVFGPVDPDIGLEGNTDLDGKVVLLQIDAYDMPEDHRPFTFGNYGFTDGHWVFLIKEEDLKKRNFKKVEFIEMEL